MEPFSLAGKVAVVTGASGLLGQEHCRGLIAAGAAVVACDLDLSRLEALATELGSQLKPVVMDVADLRSVEGGYAEVLRAWDKVDVLVNNAAINDRFESPALAAEKSKFENYPVEMFRQMMDVNVTGTFLCSQVFGRSMVKQRSGSIINIASTYGMVAPDQSLYRKPNGEQAFYKSAGYPASKGAILAFTRFLAAYWGGSGIRVNSLSPGGVENQQDSYFVENYAAKTPLGRMAQPGDYRGALVFLASDASSYMTGSNLVVDGGWTAW